MLTRRETSRLRKLLRPVLSLGLLLGALATLVMASWTPGPQFQVNTFTPGSQLWPAVGMNANGSSVIAWTSFGQDGDTFGIFAQRYDASGMAVGSEFQVNTTTAGEQRQPAAAVDAAGNFVIVWSQPGATSDAIFARLYDGSNGQPLGTEFQVNAVSAGTRFRSRPVVAMDANGNFAVVWEGTSTDEPSGGIFARLFDSSGMALGNRAEFVVNTTTADVQSEPAVAMNANGDFVVAWTSHGQDEPFSDGVFAQRLDGNGSPLGGEFQVNTTTANSQFQPAVSIDSNGNTVIAWVSRHTGGIFARGFQADGTPLDDEFPVSTLAAQTQRNPSVGMDAAGDVVVTWDMTDNNDTATIQARLFDSSLTPQAVEFQVNDPAHDPTRNALGMDASGDFVVAWEDQSGADGEHSGIFARRYTSPVGSLSLSIDDVRLLEGDSGFVNAVFTVTLSRASADQISVDFFTADGTAGAALTGADYQEQSGRVVFDPDETSREIQVRVNGDTFSEADETFFVSLRNPDKATISDGQGVGTILNDDNWLSIDDVTVTEGNSGTRPVTFTVSVLPGVSDHQITVDFAATSGTASGLDYVPRSGTLTFQPREGLKEIHITINGDLLPEADETFFVNLRNSTNANIAKAVGVGTIVNDDFSSGTVGSQFLVNSTVSGFQWSAAVGMNAAGKSVVAWSSEIPGIGEGIFAQRFNSDGTRAGSQFRVDDATGVCTSFPRRREPAVGMDADGDFVIVWTTAAFAISGTQFDDDYAFSDVCAQRYRDDGTPLGSNFQVDTNLNHTAHSQSPAIGMYGNGDFVIAWSGQGPRAGGAPRAIFAKGFNSSGAPLWSTAGTLPCNNAFTGALEVCDTVVSPSDTVGLYPAVAVDPGVPGCPAGVPSCGILTPADFYIAWESLDIFARGFSGGNGQPIGNEFLVNTYTDNPQEKPLARMDEHGRMVVVWQGEGDGGRRGIFGQRFGPPSGGCPFVGCGSFGFGPRGGQFEVFSQQGSLGFVRVGLAMDAQHGFVVTWNNLENDTTANHAIFARFFAPDSTPQGNLFQVNDLGSSYFRPAAGMDSSGNSLIAWEGGNDGSGSGIFARRFQVPNTLAGTNIVVTTPPVSLGFANVTQAGNTTVSITTSGPAPPSSFAVGNPALYFDLNTSAVFSGNVTVCISYKGVVFNVPPGPQLLHFENAVWVDVTTFRDTVNEIVCGVVTSLSPFGLFEPTEAQDTTPPQVQCAAPDGQWHATDVSLACTATDGGSGLANTEDASFSLSTHVDADTETSNAATGSREVCDAAGNCATAGPIAGNMIDRKPPSIAIDALSGPYIVRAAVTPGYSCQDGGSGVASCAALSTTLDTTTVGMKLFTVRAEDRVGNRSSRSVEYVVSYGIGLLYDSLMSKRAGSAYPLKVQLRDASGANLSSPEIVLHAIGITRSSGEASGPLDDTGNANPDFDFRYDAALGGYVFNLSTKGVLEGRYNLNIRAGADPTLHSAPFAVR